MAYRTYRHTFTNQVTVDIPGSMHGLGTGRLIIEVFLADAPYPGGCLYDSHIDPQTGDVCLQFCYTVMRAIEPPLRVPQIFRGLRILRRWYRTRWLARLLLGELELQPMTVWEGPQSGVIVLHAVSP
jgi:hypothetical protein